jgi:hypothetical protein
MSVGPALAGKSQLPHREIDIEFAGLFPAKAGTTGALSVRGCLPTQSVERSNFHAWTHSR